MGEREELNSQDSKLRVKKQELEKQLRELEKTGANVSCGEKMEVIQISEEKLDEIERIKREISEIENEQKVIIEKLRKLSPSNKQD